eukprot:295897_1
MQLMVFLKKIPYFFHQKQMGQLGSMDYFPLCQKQFVKDLNGKASVYNDTKPELNVYFEQYTSSQNEINSKESPVINHNTDLITTFKVKDTISRRIEFSGYFGDIFLTLMTRNVSGIVYDIIEWKLDKNKKFYPYKIYQINIKLLSAAYNTHFSTTSDRPYFLIWFDYLSGGGEKAQAHKHKNSFLIFDLFALTQDEEKLKKNKGIINKPSFNALNFDTDVRWMRHDIFRIDNKYILMINIPIREKVFLYTLDFNNNKIMQLMTINETIPINGTNPRYLMVQDINKDNIFYVHKSDKQLRFDIDIYGCEYKMDVQGIINYEGYGIDQHVSLFTICNDGRHVILYAEKSRMSVRHRYRFCALSPGELKTIEEREQKKSDQVWIVDLLKKQCIWYKKMRVHQYKTNQDYKDKQYVIIGDTEIVVLTICGYKRIDLYLRYEMENAVNNYNVNIIKIISQYIDVVNVESHQRNATVSGDKFDVVVSKQYKRITMHKNDYHAAFCSFDLT